jgi:hypothetical protein
MEVTLVRGHGSHFHDPVLSRKALDVDRNVIGFGAAQGKIHLGVRSDQVENQCFGIKAVLSSDREEGRSVCDEIVARTASCDVTGGTPLLGDTPTVQRGTNGHLLPALMRLEQVRLPPELCAANHSVTGILCRAATNGCKHFGLLDLPQCRTGRDA